MKKIEVANINWALEKLGFKTAGKLFHASLSRRLLNGPRRVHLQKYLAANTVPSISADVASQLRAKGVAVAKISDFSEMPDIGSLKEEFSILVRDFQANPRQIGDKAFIQRLVQDDLDTDRFPAIRQYLLNAEIALATGLYLGLTPKLTSFKVWRSHYTGEQERSGSQNWHRDFNEKQMVRVFLYFNDVRTENGAGEYVTGTHYLGDDFDSLQYSEELGTYATQDQVNDTFPIERQVVAEGPPGTIYFIDTAGLHRGGYHAADSVRDVALTTFSTNSDLMATNFRFHRALLDDLPSTWARRVFMAK